MKNRSYVGIVEVLKKPGISKRSDALIASTKSSGRDNEIHTIGKLIIFLFERSIIFETLFQFSRHNRPDNIDVRSLEF